MIHDVDENDLNLSISQTVLMLTWPWHHVLLSLTTLSGTKITEKVVRANEHQYVEKYILLMFWGFYLLYVHWSVR